MRIRVIQKPTLACIDGIRLDLFEPRLLYDVGNTLGAYLVAQGWAEPLACDDPALLKPLVDFELPDRPDVPDSDPFLPLNLRRESYPPYYDGPPLAADRRRRRRSHEDCG